MFGFAKSLNSTLFCGNAMPKLLNLLFTSPKEFWWEIKKKLNPTWELEKVQALHTAQKEEQKQLPTISEVEADHQEFVEEGMDIKPLIVKKYKKKKVKKKKK